MAASFHFMFIAPRRVRRAAPVVPPVLTEEETEALTEALTELLTEGTEFVTEMDTDFVTESGTGFFTEGGTAGSTEGGTAGSTENTDNVDPTDNFDTDDGDTDFDVSIDFTPEPPGANLAIVVDIPAGDPDDLLVIYIHQGGSSPAGVPLLNAPAGYTLIHSNTSTIYRYAAWWRVSDGTETTATFTIASGTATSLRAVCVRVKNHDGFDTFQQITSASNSVGSSVIPAVTTTKDADLLLHFIGGGSNSQLCTGSPGGTTQIGFEGLATDTGIEVFTEIAGATGSQGTRTFTFPGTNRPSATTVAIKTKGNPAFLVSVTSQQDSGSSDQLVFEDTNDAWRYWEVNVTANNGSSNNIVNASEAHLYDGGVDLAGNGTGTGTATASTNSAQAPNLFDGNTATAWISLSGQPYPHWVRYDFGSGNAEAIDELGWKCINNGGRGINTFSVRCSDDGVTWTTAYSTSGVTWTATQEQNFPFTPPVHPALPLGLAVRDTLIAAIAHTGAAGAITPPSGWELLEGGGVVIPGDSLYLSFYTKRVEASDLTATQIVFTSANAAGGMTGVIAGFHGNVARTNISFGNNPSATLNTVNAGAAYYADDLAIFTIAGLPDNGESFSSSDGTLIESMAAGNNAPALRVQYEIATVDTQGMISDITYSVGSRTARVTAILI